MFCYYEVLNCGLIPGGKEEIKTEKNRIISAIFL